MYPLCCIKLKQFSVVNMLNAIASRVLGWVDTWNTSSFAFSMLFTWLKTSSKGIISGEYGGRNITLAFALVSIKFTTWSRWWLEQLSMITSEWLLFLSSWFKLGIRVFMTKSSNFYLFAVPSTSACWFTYYFLCKYTTMMLWSCF